MAVRRDGDITGRLFLVGCERSGTTLLQAMLAQNSRVFSFPESHVFCRIVPRKKLYRRLGVANWRTATPVLRELAERCLRHGDWDAYIPKRTLLLRSYAGAFVRMVDESAREAGADLWLEKTPHHLDHADAITSLVPSARFIHILRDGRDVAASIRDASLTDGGYWGEWSVERLASHWNECMRKSCKYLGNPKHYFVSYEALIEDPSAQLTGVCGFMGLNLEPAMLRHWEASGQVTGWMGDRPWMDKAHQPVQDTRLKKYHAVFSRAERGYLEEHLLDAGRVTGTLGPREDAPAAMEVA